MSFYNTEIEQIILWAVLGYFLGTIPFGLILTKLAGYGDIRKIGSGNIGATNVLRTGNKFLAITTLILDAAKGALAIGLAHHLEASEIVVLSAGAGAMFGHIFPVWLKFKGGKGVATALGTLLAASWPVGLAACATWLITAFSFRISSLAALVALGLSPLFAWIWAGPQLALFSLAITVLVFIRHQGNIRRLLQGTEPKIGQKKTAKESQG